MGWGRNAAERTPDLPAEPCPSFLEPLINATTSTAASSETLRLTSPLRGHVQVHELADSAAAAIVTPVLSTTTSSPTCIRDGHLDRRISRIRLRHPPISNVSGYRDSRFFTLRRRLGSQTSSTCEFYEIVDTTYQGQGTGQLCPHHRFRERCRPHPDGGKMAPDGNTYGGARENGKLSQGYKSYGQRV